MAVSALAEGLRLGRADVVDRGELEASDIECVEHPGGVRQARGGRGRISGERVRVAAVIRCRHSTSRAGMHAVMVFPLRSGTTSSSCGWPVRSTIPVANGVGWVAVVGQSPPFITKSRLCLLTNRSVWDSAAVILRVSG